MATAHRWWHRWQAASEAERADRSCLGARPPVPRSCPWRLTEAEEQRILDARERTNYGPARLAGLVGRRRSTIHKVLARHGRSRRRRTPRERSSRRYEWAEPGALLHQDTKRLQRFYEPGHWATGDRSELAANRGAGYVYAHCVLDDRTRLAYVEVLDNEQATTAVGFLQRAVAFYARHAITVERVMTDNGSAYRSTVHALACRLLGIRHLRTRPYRPRTNGKACVLASGCRPSGRRGSPRPAV